MSRPRTTPLGERNPGTPRSDGGNPSARGTAKGIFIGAALVIILIAGAALYWAYQGRSRLSGLFHHAASCCSESASAAVAELSPDEKQQAYQEEVSELRGRVARLEAYLGAFPKPLYDLDALSQSLTTPQAAFEYVRDQIALEPYPGIMKGAPGTFLTRGGNDLDRALLLAALLKQQNIAVKIAHGKLPAAQAQSLLQQIIASPGAQELILKSIPTEPPPLQLTENQRSLGSFLREVAAARRRELTEAVDRNFQLLESALKSAGLPIGQDATGDQLKILQDHYWVQATLEEQTVDLDPGFSSAKFGQKFADAEESLDSEELPDNLFQRVRFRLVAEHLKDGRTASAELISQETKATDLWGKNFRLALAPQSDSPDVNEFQPSLVIGDETTTGQLLQIRPQEGGDESAGGDEGGNLLGGIGGVGSSGLQKQEAKKSKARPTGGVLGRVYFEVVCTAPHLPDVPYRRVILDRLESRQGRPQLQPAIAEDRAIRALLIQVWDGAVSMGPVHPLYVVQTQLAALKALAPLEEKVRAQLYLSQEYGPEDNPGPTLSPELITFLFSSDLTRYELQQQAAPRARSYYERPRLAFYRRGVAVQDWSAPAAARRYQEGVDLLNAPFRFAGPLADSVKLAMKTGIADTALERFFKANQASFNALPLFAAAAEQKIPLLTIGSVQKATLDSVPVSPAIMNILQRELAEGRTLILPARLVSLNQTQTFGWWSLDSSTGYALGKMELGGAQGMVESAEMHEKVAKWTEIFVKFYGNLLKCYMMGLASALGEVDYYGPGGAAPAPGSGQGIILYHGKPGQNPMPTSKKIAECAISAACDALADIMNEMAGGSYGAGEWNKEVHALEEIIFNFAADQAADYVGNKAITASCEAALKSAMK